MPDLKQLVREHWEAAPCGGSLAQAPTGTAEFFRQVEEQRYRLEPFIPGFADFNLWRGRRVLEIGTGLGTDFLQFARAGAILSGIDLTEAAVSLVRTRLDLEGCSAELVVGDAEALPFDSGSFELVYSWGVLHHTPDPRRALSEVRRVLMPGGEARIMLYSRRSWVAFGLWLRWALLAGHPRRSLADVVASHMESPGTKAYTPRDLRELFANFDDVRLTRWLTPYDRRVAGPMTVLAGSRLGWFAGITARRY